MTATTELREASARIRRVVVDIDTLHQRYPLAELQIPLVEMGFANSPLALATASWLDQEADTLDLLNIEPTTSLTVARHILKAAA